MHLKDEQDEENDEGKDEVKGEQEEGESAGSKSRLRPKSGVEDTNPENWLPHCYTSCEAMKGAYLEKLLTDLFPHRFNAFQYSTLKRALKGQTGAPSYQEALLQMLQFLTGQDTVSSLVGDMRHRPTLLASLSSGANSRDGWVNSIHFPLDWQAIGIYRLATSEGRCLLSSRLHDVGDVDITDLVLQAFGVETLEGLVLQLDKNFNHVQATVIDATTGKALKGLHDILRDQVKTQQEVDEAPLAPAVPCVTPPPKRAKIEETA
eukprot:4276298-Amphidinium_carterae.3